MARSFKHYIKVLIGTQTSIQNDLIRGIISNPYVMVAKNPNLGTKPTEKGTMLILLYSKLPVLTFIYHFTLKAKILSIKPLVEVLNKPCS